jgi:lipocalin
MPDVSESLRLVGTFGFPIVIAMFMFRQYFYMHKENIAAMQELSDNIISLSHAIAMQQQWLELTRLPPSYQREAVRVMADHNGG